MKLALLLLAAVSSLAANSFERHAHPVLKRYCLDCHSTEKHKGELDLERFSSEGLARQEPKVWQMVVEQMALGEMPPKEKPQPSAAERKQLLDWIQHTMEALALERAGDPGPVVLRRLSNAEYTYTVRDLTGVPSLDPAREFPVDGAAGEGFMNTGQALVMSPSLVAKYLDAGKLIASHAVLGPVGLRFSPATTRRDWTEEILANIREFYRKYTDPRGGETVNLQGVIFETNEGGRLPLEKYLSASFAVRDGEEVDEVARAHGLSAKYLKTLTQALQASHPSPLLDPLRARWREGTPADAAAIAAEIAPHQKALWKFSSVGHIGKAGGPKAWMEPVNPIVERQEVRLKLPTNPAGDVTVYFVTGDAGDGSDHDSVTWQQARLEAPGRPSILLRDLETAERVLTKRRDEIVVSASRALAAAAAARRGGTADALADQYHLDPATLNSWTEYLGIGGAVKLEGHFTSQMKSVGGYAFVNGWGSPETPLLVANSSDQHVRIPGNMKGGGVAVHPSPNRAAAVGWQSPVAGFLRVSARVTHAHPECGNGITWLLEARRGSTRQRLASGTAQGNNEGKAGPVDRVRVREGDLISLVIGPRGGNHACDLTAVDLTIFDGQREWDLAREVSPDVLMGNPQSDHFGHADVWHFYTEPDKVNEGETGVPNGSILAQWLESDSQEEQARAVAKLKQLLTGNAPASGPDAELRRQLTSLTGPILRGQWAALAQQWEKEGDASFVTRAPTAKEIRVPAELAAGAELVATAVVDGDGSVQVQVSTAPPAGQPGLVPSTLQVRNAAGQWTSNNRSVSHQTPILTRPGSPARARVEAALEEFRALFPAALCYSKIVPVDEVVTLTLYHREDDQLARLMLSESERAELDRLWDELHYVSQDALTLVDAFEQLWQYATQDADPKVFEPLREPIQRRAAAFHRRVIETEPQHLAAVVDFASRAYRRPLEVAEREQLIGLYHELRAQELSHEESVRLMLARVFVAPAFLYKLEKAPGGVNPAPVSNWELATRLSYFLWSSPPDQQLLSAAANGSLLETEVLVTEARRMLRDSRVRRLAVEFACQWLHVHGFDSLDEKSERHFPTFASLRGPMYEESILFFLDLFQRNGTVLDILAADYTFLNEELAAHYGIPEVRGADWRRVEGLAKFGRGGILGQATTLAKQSGASRSSPILRGNWVSETLLGEKLPRPPKDVPPLPEEEGAEGRTIRELTERHSSDPRCASCHIRIDPFGFALESFDAIGRKRAEKTDTRARAMDGSEFDGLEGLREYLLTKRRDSFVHQFCRKLLGYALGREIQLSDGPLLKEMRAQLAANNYQVHAAVETIVRSRQFREIRGRDAVFAD